MPLIFNGRSWGHGNSSVGVGVKPSRLPLNEASESHSASYYLLLDAAIVSTGDAVDLVAQNNTQVVKSVHVDLVGNGSVAATIIIEVCNDLSSPTWIPLKTFSLSGTNSVGDGFLFSEPYAYVRARLTDITGTDATVNSIMSV